MSKCRLEKESASRKCSSSKESLRNIWDASVTLGKGSDTLTNSKASKEYEDSSKSKSQYRANPNITAKQHRFAQLQSTESQHSTDSHVATVASDKIENLTTTTFNLPKHNTWLRNTKPKHARQSFLYEHYPLKPSLLYGSPSKVGRDHLKLLDQISYLPQKSLHSISASLTTFQCALVNPRISPVDRLENLQHTRLGSGAEARSNNETVISDTARKTRSAYKAEGETVENVCANCRRNAFLVSHGSQYSTDTKSTIKVRDVNTTKSLGDTTQPKGHNTLSEKDKSDFDDQTNLQQQDSLLLYRNKQQRYRQESKAELNESNKDVLPLASSQSSVDIGKVSTAQATASTNSLAPDYIASVPIFEVLTANAVHNYTNQLPLKHKDSLLLYANLKKKRRKSCSVKILEVREGKLLRFVRFSDEAHLIRKPSDEDIIFSSARRLNHKAQCWDESRIAWLAELERRQEVRRRRKRRSEYQKSKQNATKSVFGQCTFLCQRIRLWLANWII
ncbi:uncharacterized protein LOC129253398 isoform X1 [Anastrepha obliqua]|uniref:uncharacterized protein LOC129253398 isoform X1 n=1 Tax=Anastrepha obliqua TaxID=95512 RepID=UPI00240A60AF|nr:uncharacterized protein LOC129253398 isoform X1 [Anastrepha obliqua]